MRDFLHVGSEQKKLIKMAFTETRERVEKFETNWMVTQ